MTKQRLAMLAGIAAVAVAALYWLLSPRSIPVETAKVCNDN